MTEQNAMRLADQAIAMIKKREDNQALWLIGDSVKRTANTDFDFGFMQGAGGKLIGVFNSQIGRRDLADAIMETYYEGDDNGH